MYSMAWADDPLACMAQMIDSAKILQTSGPECGIPGWDSVTKLLKYLDTIMTESIHTFLRAAGTTSRNGGFREKTLRAADAATQLLAEYRAASPWS